MRLRNGLLSSVLALVLLLAGLLPIPANAQTYTYKVLHDFFGGIDGSNPQCHLIRDVAGILYGTTTGNISSNGNGNNLGTVFKLDPSTNSLQTLHNFSGPDDAMPLGGLVLDANGFLYGTTYGGGHGYGTIFKMDTSGSQFQTLYSFSGPDGMNPQSGLILDSQGHLYGTTFSGGQGPQGYQGIVFRIDISGNNFQVLHSFWLDVDGANDPSSGLTLDNQGILYGTTFGGISGGAIYALDTQGNNFRILHQFTYAEGGYPLGTLALDSQGTLYGTTDGTGNNGIVFAIDTSGSNFRILHTFDVGNAGYQGLLLDNNSNLYGTTYGGGSNGYGEIFTLTTAGTNFQVLHNFTGSDGDNPYSYDVGLLLDDQGVLYGTTYDSGADGGIMGVVYALSPGSIPSGYLSINVANVSAVIGQTVTLNAVARDQSNAALLSGRTLLFYGIGGAYIGSAVTDSNGIASISYQVPFYPLNFSLPPNYPQPQVFSVHSPGDSQYHVNNGYGWVMVSSDTYFVVPPVFGTVGQTVTLRATLYRSSDNTPVPNKTVQVFVGTVGSPHIGNPHVGNAVTDSNGVATFSYKIPDDFTAGDQPILFEHLADNQYNAGVRNGQLTVDPSDTYFQVANVSGARGQTVTLSAVFYRSSDNTPLANKTVQVFVDSVHIGNTVTDGTGTATFSYQIPSTSSVGKHTITFGRFANNQYNANYSTGTLTVTP